MSDQESNSQSPQSSPSPPSLPSPSPVKKRNLKISPSYIPPPSKESLSLPSLKGSLRKPRGRKGITHGKIPTWGDVPQNPGRVDLPINHAMRALETAAGGRKRLSVTLQSASTEDLSPKEEMLIKMLADPRYSKHGLAKLCNVANITMASFLRLFQRAKGAEAYVKSVTAVYHALPDVTQDLINHSLPRNKTCSSCRGTKFQRLPTGELSTIPCPSCHGFGYHEEESDFERQKLALTIGGLVKSGGGINITQTQQVGVVTSDHLRTSPSFRAATDKVLYPLRSRSSSPKVASWTRRSAPAAAVTTLAHGLVSPV